MRRQLWGESRVAGRYRGTGATDRGQRGHPSAGSQGARRSWRSLQGLLADARSAVLVAVDDRVTSSSVAVLPGGRGRGAAAGPGARTSAACWSGSLAQLPPWRRPGAAHRERYGTPRTATSTRSWSGGQADDRDANRYLARLGFAPLVVRRIASVSALRRSLGIDRGDRPGGRAAAAQRAGRDAEPGDRPRRVITPRSARRAM